MRAFLLICGFVLANFAAEACTLTMGYKDTRKGMLIGPMGDNRGAFKDLFETAAHEIGCKLKIVRFPKARLHSMLADGTVDFYPGASFSKKRAAYLHYVPNGFETAEVGVSGPNLPTITDLRNAQQMQDVRVLAELGTSKDELRDFGAIVMKVPALSFDHVVTLLTKKRADLYVADIEYYRPYLAERGLQSLEQLHLKEHPNCCGGKQPMYMGFSKKSPHFAAVLNASYDPSERPGPTNQQLTIMEDSVVGQLAATLQRLNTEGIAKSIYERSSGPTIN